MVTYVLGLVFITGLIWHFKYRNYFKYNGGGLIVMVVSITLWVLMSFLTLIATDSNRGSYTPASGWCDAELVAVNTGQSVSTRGSFFLGTGSFDSEGYQTVTYLREAGAGVRLGEVRAIDAIIIEDGGTHLTCVQKSSTHKSDWLWPWAQETTVYSPPTYEFHIPEGSVMRDFTVAP